MPAATPPTRPAPPAPARPAPSLEPRGPGASFADDHAADDRAAALRADLAASGWTVDGVTAALGPVAAAAMGREQVVPALRATAGDTSPSAVLTRLFLLGAEVTRAQLDAALPRLGAAGAARTGLVVTAGEGPDDGVRAVVDLRPHALVDAAGEQDSWLASDLGERSVGGALPVDHVLGIGGASITLAGLAVRTPVARVLDVGTGCGVQALHAARHARRVTATDTSARALDFTRFNTRLAGIALADGAPGATGSHGAGRGGGHDGGRGAVVDLRLGSLLDPVEGELFDLVVSNPPFVVTPRRAGVPGWTYRDGGMVGDAVVSSLVTGLGRVLAPGGTAQLLGNWEHRRGEGWQDRVRGWLEAGGLDGWVVQRDVQDPAAYAETWIRDGGQRPGPESDALLEAWLDDFEERGVEGVGFGHITLHRPLHPAGPPVHRVEELTGAVPGPLGGHVADVLAATDALRATDDAALLARRLRVSADVTEERHLVPGADGPSVVLLRQGGGYGRTAHVSPALAGFVGASDGDLTGEQLVGALAALLEVDEDALRAELVPAVRGLVRDGFLLLG